MDKGDQWARRLAAPTSPTKLGQAPHKPLTRAAQGMYAARARLRYLGMGRARHDMFACWAMHDMSPGMARPACRHDTIAGLTF